MSVDRGSAIAGVGQRAVFPADGHTERRAVGWIPQKGPESPDIPLRVYPPPTLHLQGDAPDADGGHEVHHRFLLPPLTEAQAALDDPLDDRFIWLVRQGGPLPIPTGVHQRISAAGGELSEDGVPR